MSGAFYEGHVTPCAMGNKFAGVIADKIMACGSEAQLDALKPLALSARGAPTLPSRDTARDERVAGVTVEPLPGGSKPTPKGSAIG